MTIYAIGDEHDSYKRYAVFGETGFVTTTPYKSTGSRGAITAHGSMPARLEWSSAVDEIWVHGIFRLDTGAGSSNYPLLEVYNTSGDAPQFRATLTSAVEMTLYHSVGGTLTSLGTLAFGGSYRSASNPIKLMFQFKRGASGAVRVYHENRIVFETTGSYSTPSQINGIAVHYYQGSAGSAVGRLLVSDGPLFNYAFDTLLPDADGALTQWESGAYSKLAASGVYGLNSGIGTAELKNPVHTNTAGQTQLSTFEDSESIPAYQEIKAVALSGMASLDTAATPTTVSFVARHSGTTYTLNSMGLTAGLGVIPYQQILETNPAGGAWTESAINAIEFGFKT